MEEVVAELEAAVEEPGDGMEEEPAVGDGIEEEPTVGDRMEEESPGQEAGPDNIGEGKAIARTIFSCYNSQRICLRCLAHTICKYYHNIACSRCACTNRTDSIK